MQKLQALQEAVDQWPPSLMIRSRSGNSRDNKKVSCETLSKVDWYSRRPHEAQLYYRSDGDEEDNPASDAEDEHNDEEAGREDRKEERGANAGNLESHAYGEGLSPQGHHFLACFHSKALAAQGRYSAMAFSSPGRDAKKAERGPRTYPSPVPHSGNLLPHSGLLLPHSGTIKLHVGHANTHASGKLSASIRGSSLIPSNIAGKSSKSSGFGSANEPSSPKVTCLGRVKIKQKYCREMGRLADMAAVAPNDKVHKSIGDQMMKFTRRKNKAHAVEEEVVATEERQKPLPKVADMPSKGKVRSEDGKRANKTCNLRSAGATAELKKPEHENILRTDTTSDSESKGHKGKLKLKEPGVRIKFRGGDKKKWHPPSDANLDKQLSSSQADCAVDLKRFRSSDQPHGEDNRLSTSLASLSIGDESPKIGQTDDTEFVPQVPPPNSLLLMRNSKSRGACATLAASSTCRRPRGVDTYGEGVLVDRQVHLSSLKEGNFLLGVEMNERELANVHEQMASFAETKVVPAEYTPLQVKTNALAHRQVSLPKTAPPEAVSIWQRRRIIKPSTLDVGKSLTLQVKEPTTR